MTSDLVLTTLGEADQVARYARLFDSLTEVSVSPAASVAFLAEAARAAAVAQASGLVSDELIADRRAGALRERTDRH